MAGATLSALEVRADPAGDAPTLTTATVSVVEGTWPLVPSLGLGVSDLSFTARVQRSPAYGSPVRRALAGEVDGMLSLGDASYAASSASPCAAPGTPCSPTPGASPPCRCWRGSPGWTRRR